MFSLQQILVDALWVLGLAGLLATFSYMAWYRTHRGWSWRHMFSLPRLLVPVSVSLEFFCIGMGVSSLLSFETPPWWETAAWTLLAILFAMQTMVYGLAGRRHGWDTPVEERNKE